MKKKSILYILIFIIGLCLTVDVNAALKGKCTYKYTYDDSKSVMELNVNRDSFGNISIARTSYYPLGPLKILPNTVGIPFDRSNFFIAENDVLYCPDMVYLSYNTIVPSLSENDLTLTNPETQGSVKVYKVSKNGEELVPCKAGGISAGETAKSNANRYKESANKATGDSLIELQDNLRIFSKSVNISMNMYCTIDPNTYEETANILKEANEIISKKIAESNASDSIKKSSNDVQEEISEDIGKTAEIVASKRKEILIKEGNILSCEELLDKDLKDVIKWVLKIVRIAVPILLIVLVTIDFSSAVISQDQDSVKKATTKAVKRGIAAIAFFFVPLFVNIMIDWLLKYSPITVTKKNELGETVKVEMRDMTCEEVLNDDSDI